MIDRVIGLGLSAVAERVEPWSEALIARTLVHLVFQRRILAVPNCNWPGSECDLLIVAPCLRVIDVEIKISRADLKADAGKDKWRQYTTYAEAKAAGMDFRDQWWSRDRSKPVEWPSKVWKHYYVMPAEVWKPELADSLPSARSGVITLKRHTDGSRFYFPRVVRRAQTNRDAERLTAEHVVDIARLASLRMWDAYADLQAAQRRSL